ncbi:MAG: MFS transporter [Burkholderiales bacterium]|nr:MFS transporter [Burkholderiales bacterium]
MAKPDDAQRAAFRRVFGGVAMAMFLAAADQTILATALPTIASSLGGITDLSWVVVAYLLAATVAAPLYGYVGDRIGRRRALLGALGVFTVASAACALAPSFLFLVVFRALQGLGGGGLMTLAQSLIGEHIAPRERGRYAGYFAIVFGLASTSGPVLGAYLTEQFTWRAVFFVNIPLGLLAGLLALRVPHLAPPRTGRFRPDVVGALLFCAATTALLFALSSGGHRFAWLSWPLALLLAGAGIGFVALAFWERRHTDPLIPIHYLRVPAIARPDLVVLCFGAALFATIIYLPLYLQLGRGLGIGASGLLLLPITLAQVSAASITGRLVTLTGEAAIFPVIGLSLAALAFGSLAFAIYGAPTAMVLALTVLVGVGLGMVMAPLQVLVQTAAGRHALGVATASLSLCRSVGGATGVALVGAVLFALIDRAADGAGALLHQTLEGGAASVARLTPEERAAMSGQVNDAYRVAFLLLAAIAATGALVARTVPRLDWSKAD